MAGNFGKRKKKEKVFHFRDDNSQIVMLQEQNRRQKEALDRVMDRLKSVRAAALSDGSPFAKDVVKILDGEDPANEIPG